VVRIVEAEQRNPENLLVCAVATHWTTGLEMLLESCKRFSIGLTILGWGQPYPGHHWKLSVHREALTRLRRQYEWVLAIDGFDCLFTCGLEEIIKKFRRCHTPLLMGAEINCHPPQGPRPEDYPPAPTRYRHVNSGGYIGELSTVLDIFEAFERDLRDQDDDQAFWAHVYVSGQAPMTLDHHNHIFQCLWMADDDVVVRRRVHNRATGSTPSIIHGNGFVDMRPLYDRLLGRHYRFSLLRNALRRSRPTARLPHGLD
jgi:hypothetical protein